MNGETKNRMQCAEFEAILSDALDGLLSTSDDIRFKAHLASCSSCAPMFHEAEAGLKWLSALKDDETAEPSPMLAESILRATIGTSPIPQAPKQTKSWLEHLKETPFLAPVFQAVFQPRFAMGFGMAFFSITMLLNLAGVQLNKVDLRPAAIVTAYYETTGKIVKYWENLRFVYKIETQIRDLKNAAAPSNNSAPQSEQKQENQNKQDEKDRNRETSKVQDQDRDKNLTLAEATADLMEGNGQRLQEPGQRRSL